MKNLRRFFIIPFIMLFALNVYAQPVKAKVKGQVINKENQTPVAYANISILGSKKGTACDSTGRFNLTLPTGEYDLEISAIGFKPLFKTIDLVNNKYSLILIKLRPAIITYTEDILVYGEKETLQNMEWFNSTDDLIQKAEGVSMIRRANFALEPTIRGMSAGRIGLMVDGMKMFGACIDRMDPVTAYVETENLEKLEVSKGSFDMTQALSLGGTINLITHKPEFNQILYLESEIGYESVSNLKKIRGMINFADSSLAIRATISLKKSEDFFAGENLRVLQSGYYKNNYKIDMTKLFNTNHVLEFSFIGDNAEDIGYPPLLMDTRQTKSQIFRIEHTWQNPTSFINSLSSKLYYNRIDHWMDDYEREVSARVIMPDMYMPMFGKTKTIGLVEQIDFRVTNRHQLNLIFDLYRLSAFADMKMISIFPDVSEAYLINLGDIQLYSFATVVDHNWILSEKTRVRTNIRYDYSPRDLENEFGRRQLTGFWDIGKLKNNYSVISFSSSVEYSITNKQVVQLSLALNHRLPTHIENYGFFLYEITDGFFYTGNPQLKPEQSRQIELAVTQMFHPFNIQAKVYFIDVKDYIGGLLSSGDFKIYSNIASALITGAEIHGNIRITHQLNFYASAEYTYGQNRTLKEPLPFIPPLEAKIGLNFQKNSFGLGINCRIVSNQNRIAFHSTLEDITGSFFLLNFNSRVKLINNLSAYFGVDNIFDKLYHEHLSINNFPSRGRNIYGGLIFDFGI